MFYLSRLNPSRPVWISAALVTFAFVGLAMFVLYIVVLNRSLPGLSYTATGTWMSAFMFTFAVTPHFQRGGLCIRCSSCAVGLCPAVVDFFWRYYNVTVASVSIFLCIGWFVGGRYDGGLWAIALLALAALNIYAEKCDSNDDEAALELGWANKHGVVPQNGTKKSGSVGACVVVYVRFIAWIMYGLLLGGCWVQAVGIQHVRPRRHLCDHSGAWRFAEDSHAVPWAAGSSPAHAVGRGRGRWAFDE